jgi:Zn-dependent metalloprotease
MTHGRRVLTLLAAALVAGVVSAAQPNPELVGEARNHILNLRPTLGLDDRHDFALLKSSTDNLGQTHAHFQQRFQGLRVWEGDVIIHMDASGHHLPLTDALVRNINLSPEPSLTTGEALAIVHQDLAPRGTYAHAPSAELVVFPEKMHMPKAGLAQHSNSDDFDYQVTGHHLAYYVHTSLRNTGETKDMDYLVDAHTGAILKKWNTLHESAATGTGNSQYSGTVSISTNYTGSSYSLTDTLHGSTTVLDMGNSTTSNGTLFTNSTDTWGNGQNYYDNGTSGATNGTTGQTAAVDALWGFEMTWDYYKNVHGRNGIDGNGTATSLRMHYDSNYDNAYWDDTCFCMTFGDGSAPASGGFKNLTAIDIIGHELSHGVIANNGHGGLTYSGESGGLNEADSDIHGTFVTYYGYNGGTGSVVPNTIPSANLHGYTPWTIGSQISNPPLRYMYKPSLDGSSPDAWSSSIGNLDVHYSSGPGNRVIYFLAQGATASGNTSTTYLPNGMTGIGNDHAARIWYRAETTYFTSGMTYAQCRTACMNAASDLYGTSSAEYAAVQNAFHGINVGAAAPTPTNTVTATITTPSANTTVASGASVSFVGSATDSSTSATLTYGWKFGDGATATGASASHVFTNNGSANTTYTVTFTATDNTSATGSATRVITVTPAPPSAPAITSQPASQTVTAGQTATFSVTATGGSLSYQWKKNGTAISGATAASYTTPATTTADSGSSFTVTVSNSAGSVTSNAATLTVNPASTAKELMVNGGFESGATSWTGTTGDIGTFSGEPAYEGTKDAWLCGNGSTATETLYQAVTIPSTATSATLSFYLHIDTAETTTTTAYDKLAVQVLNNSGTVLGTLATYSNLNAASGYTQKTFDLSAYKGQMVRIYFKGTEDSSLQTSFVLDKVSLLVK